MQTIRDTLAMVAAALPVAVCFILGYRLVKNRQTDWKVAACLSASALATALLALLATEKILFLKYGDAILEINQKKLDVERLTEQNRRLAIETAKAIEANLDGVMASESYDSARATKATEELLKAAGVSKREIDQILRRTNSPTAKP